MSLVHSSQGLVHSSVSFDQSAEGLKFDLMEPDQVVPEGTEIVSVRCDAKTLDLPASVKEVIVENGASLEVVPGVETVCVRSGAKVEQFSDGTVSIDDMREDVVIRKGDLDHVTTLRTHRSIYTNEWPAWLPPTLEEISTNCIDNRSIPTYVNLRKLTVDSLGARDILPTTVRDLAIAWHDKKFVVPWHLKRLYIEEGAFQLDGDFRSLTDLTVSIDIWNYLIEEQTLLPALRRLSLGTRHGDDLTGHVFPEGIVELKLCGFVGSPIFPRSLKFLRLRKCDPSVAMYATSAVQVIVI